MDNRANKLTDQIMASGDPAKMQKTVANPNFDQAEFDRLTGLGKKSEAALFASTTSTPRGRDEILRTISNNFTKGQINRKGRAGFLKNFGADFYKYLNQ